jgi:GNAT superfamily N-acetyltransferase
MVKPCPAGLQQVGKDKILVRMARRQDASLLLDLIKELASYEKRAKQVSAELEDIKKFIFEKQCAKAVIADLDGHEAGFAVFYISYSTFLGKPGIYIEDLFVKPGLRHKGIGTRLLKFIASLASQWGYPFIEWSVLKWNKPSIRFYERLGAKPKSEWALYRLDEKMIKKIAKE